MSAYYLRRAHVIEDENGDRDGLGGGGGSELLDGIGRLAPGRQRRSLAVRFNDLLDDLFQDRIVDWSLADAQACARIMEDKRRRGEPLDDHVPDAFLAAVATTRGLAIVTRNTGEFRNTGVKTVDLWTARPR